MKFTRVALIVLDSVGVGAMPDAARFGDAGSDTLGHVAAFRPLQIPNLASLGAGNIRPLPHIGPARPPAGAFGRCALASGGKDTTSGHWEMAGVTLRTPFPTYPEGFPPEVIDAFTRETGLQPLGNIAASGTEIIQQLGSQHLETGRPIVYTSADSVFQIAAHEESFGLERLYEVCATARRLLAPPHEVGRVIARPFVGQPDSFRRTSRRRDFAIPPPRDTLLDRLVSAGVAVEAIGKIASIFCQRGVSREIKTTDNASTGAETLKLLRQRNGSAALIFANFVDFDMLYGHRNDVAGYAGALEAFDRQLDDILAALADDDLLIVTSDHGCDPSTPSTDHSREYTLLLATHRHIGEGVSLGTRDSLADIGATIAENFGVALDEGASFLAAL